MEFRVLGPLEVVRDGQPVPLGAAKQRALLALLVLRANELVSRDRLVDEIWGEEPPPTAAHAVEVYVSQLRKLLARDGEDARQILQTRPPGYVLHVGREELDLHRFERLFAEGRAALVEGEAARAATTLREALALWRGEPLADIAELFAHAETARLAELHATALETRVDADLQLGRHAELVSELEALTARHPLRERLRGQHMLALYRSGRQADALRVYDDTRRILDEELGLEPSPALRRLQYAVLTQDASIDTPATESKEDRRDVAPARVILVVPFEEASVAVLIGVAEPLAGDAPARELIVAHVVASAAELARATAALHEQREKLLASGVAARAVAFTSANAAADVVRLATEQDADLLLIDLPRAALVTEAVQRRIDAVLSGAPCDVALVAPSADVDRTGPILVPFGGAEHDWAAVEFAAWNARARRTALTILGSAGDPEFGQRDASRLLATASLIIQRYLGITAQPLLVEAGVEPILEAAEGAALLVAGVSDRWRREGLGEIRLALADRAPAPTIFVRRGVRPGALAPRESMTRFTWSLPGGAAR